jgi:amino acid adenylation domain-containing protein
MANNSFSNLTPVDQYLTISLFNERKAKYPDGFVHEYFEDQAKLLPNKTAVIFESNSITYQQLDQRANQLANFLYEKGIQPDSFVCVSLTKSIDMLVVILGILKAGAAYIPIEPLFPKELIDSLVTDASPYAIITSSEFSKKFEKLSDNLVLIDKDKDVILKQSTVKPKVTLKDNNLVYAIYTSGSTGKRKAAQIEHRSLTNQRFAWKESLQIGENDIVLQTAPFSFDVFTADWVKTLTYGGTLVINPKNLVLEPDNEKTGEYLYKLLVDNGITVADFTPAILRKLLHYSEKNHLNLDFLRLIVVGCDSWYTNEHRELVEFTKGKTRVVDSYGMTECTVDCSYYEGYNDFHEATSSLIGKPYFNNEIYILDENGMVVPVGQTGELCVTGITLTRGYLNRPDLNKEKFGTLTFPNGQTQRYYKSGDLARFNTDGTLEFLGRKDSQIEIGGIRVELGEIEKSIQKNEEVYENTVLAIPGKDHTISLTAFLVLKKGSNLSEKDIKNFLAEKLPAYMIPQNFIFLDSIPLTVTGKLDRTKLATQVESIRADY